MGGETSIRLVDALDAEIAALTAELDDDPRVVKLRELRRVRDLYVSPVSRPHQRAQPRQSSGSGRRSSPERQRMLEAIRAWLTECPDPQPTARIVEFLIGQGFDPPGENKVNALSAAMSNARGMFMSHGRSGWTAATDGSGLRDPVPEPTLITDTADPSRGRPSD